MQANQISLICSVSMSLMFIASACAKSAKAVDCRDVVNNPIQFDQRLTVVIGVAHVRLEDDAIYPRAAADKKVTPASGIWLRFPENSTKFRSAAIHKRYAPFDGKTVEIVGKVYAKDRGHGGAFAATLEVQSISQVNLNAREDSH
jgi:hypothetical protein